MMWQEQFAELWGRYWQGDVSKTELTPESVEALMREAYFKGYDDASTASCGCV